MFTAIFDFDINLLYESVIYASHVYVHVSVAKGVGGICM